MKKLLILIMLMFFYNGYSQAITVNKTPYTVEELVNKVLVNSPCVLGSKISSSTGTNYSSSNGIGYFENTNTNFPFKKGIILSTGDVTKTPGPNASPALADGSATWRGDSDLEANLLSQSGVTIKSINASYIEFDFTPITPTFSFPFVFASEEYGTSQCTFSDAFAFLLKDVTAGGAYTNIAVIPGTNIPVSVETIRDIAYNATCPSANSSYFDTFNGTAFTTAINFNGQTKEMTALATGLDVNHTYRIKIVIADGNENPGNDSAIFLGASTLSTGTDILGEDYTVANGKAICSGETLPTLSPGTLKAGTSYEWKKQGVAFSPVQTGSMLNLNSLALANGMHNFSLTYKEPGCIEVTDEIIVEINPKIAILTTIPDIYACNNGASTYEFDLKKNSAIILAGVNQAASAAGALDDLPASTLISYHLTNTDAVNKTSQLPLSYSISNTESGRQIFVRVQNPTTLCYEIRSFKLEVVAPPIIANIPSDMTSCSTSYAAIPLQAYFYLNSQIASILGSQSTTYNKISLHYTLEGAKNNTNPVGLRSPGDFIITYPRILYIRLQNISNNDCYVTTQFNLNVTRIPEVDVFSDVFVCSTTYTLPPLLKAGSQYWTKTNGTGTQLYAGDSVSSNNTTLYIYNKSGACSNQDAFTINKVDASSIKQTDVSVCNEYTLPTLAFGKYYVNSGGTSTPGNTTLTAGTKIKNTQTIYIWFQDAIDLSCKLEKSFTVTIIPFTDLPAYTNQFECDKYIVPIDPNEGSYYTGNNKTGLLPTGTEITSTTTIYVYKETNTTPTNCKSEKSFTVFIGADSITVPTDLNSCSTYILPPLAFGEYRDAPSGGGNVIPVGTDIKATTTLWFYIAGQNCTNKEFTITVSITPLDEIPDTAPQCDFYILPTVTHTGDYFTGSLGTGQKLSAGDYITNTQTLYFYDKIANGSCYVQEDFLITINPSPLIDIKPNEVVRCGATYMLDDLTNGEYYEFSGGPSSVKPNPILPAGTIITESKTIYVYAVATAPNTCYLEYPIDIFLTYVNKIADVSACNSYVLPAIVGMGNYYTQPDGKGIKLTAGTEIKNTTTLYVFEENNNRVLCKDEDDFTITIYNSPIITPIVPVTACGSYSLPQFTAPVTRYFTKPGGPGINNTEKIPGDPITVSTIIYAYAASGTTTTICPTEAEMKIDITAKPVPKLTIPVICNDIENGTKFPSVIESDLTASKYSSVWKNEAGAIVGTNSPTFSTDIAGKYSLTVTDTSIFGCVADAVLFEVLESSKPKSVTVDTSGWFTSDQTVTVTALPYPGFGNNFLYSLDGGSPQTSNVFNNVSSGIHEITVSDANCVSLAFPLEIKLINSPRFFTPNGDGYNDTWNITGIPTGQNFKLYIFDRYGKLVKELLRNGAGWDGTFNGNPLPADDYWFTITYTENNITKEYKSHFSLKR